MAGETVEAFSVFSPKDIIREGEKKLFTDFLPPFLPLCFINTRFKNMYLNLSCHSQVK